MTDESLARVRSIFEAAYELTPEERSAYLDRGCGADAELRARVEALLAANDADDPFLSEPTGGHGVVPVALGSIESPGSMIGRYKLLEQIGEGGFGTVFMAEQEEPVRRRVALKIIKPGMDTKQVIARFEAERQALAMMDHPGIARVFDAGATESGRPYFVMELVRGDPITAYCDQDNLSTRERLDLFTQVCHAVQHAHQKGVIHRDIKPNNVLVTVVDGKPVPKVIDFGIAKATESKLTELTLFTEHRALIGTPAYMSPEQAVMSGVDVDTRSDIYSLGVLLYELLTGTTPFDTKALLAAGFAEIQRIIREVEPDKPSTRLSTLKGTAARGPSPGKTETARVSALVRGDLDWIVMKALEKERARRYESASGLAADVERHLAGEPVEAAPPSRAYRVRKFVRRHRAGVTAASLVVISLAAGVVGTTIGLMRAEERRRDAVRAQEQTQRVSDFQAAMLTGIDAASMGRRIKDLMREQVGAVLERRQLGTFPDGRALSPDEIEAELEAFNRLVEAAHGADIARGVMDEFVLGSAGASIDAQFDGEPVVRARLHQALGTAYRRLGLYDLAESHLVSALEAGRLEPGKADELLASCLADLAGLLLDRSEYAAAEPLIVEALDMNRRLHGEESLPVARCLNMLGGVTSRTDDVEGERLLREALAMRRAHGAPAMTIATNLNNLAELLKDRGDGDGAEPLLTEALTLARGVRDEHPLVARMLHNLGQLYTDRDEFDAAEPLLLEALAMQRGLLGDEHPDVGICLIDLGVLHQEWGDTVEAKKWLYEALATFRAIYGDTHPSVARTLGRLVRLLWAERDFETAEPLAREALAINRALLPPDHPEIARSLNELALLRKRRGDPDEAERFYLEALDIQRAKLGDHPYVADTLYNLARLREDTGDPRAAEPYLRDALTMGRKIYPGDHPRTALYLHHLGKVLLALDHLEEAERLTRESVAMYASHPEWGELSEHTHAITVLTDIYIAADDKEEAAAINRESLEVRRRFPRGSLELASSLNTAAKLYGRTNHFAEAAPLFRECITIYSNLFPDGHARGWNKHQVMCYLGDALAHRAGELRDTDPEGSRDLLEEAEQHLLEGYGGMKDEPALANSRGDERKREALASIVMLYETWDALSPNSGRSEQAARWRAELEKLPPP